MSPPPRSREKSSFKTTPKPSKPLHNIDPLTPAQTHEQPSSLPLRRRSLRLASISPHSSVRVSDHPTQNAPVSDRNVMGKTLELNGSDSGKGFLNLRSGKKVQKRGVEQGQGNTVQNGTAKRTRKTTKEEEDEEGVVINSVDAVKLDNQFEEKNDVVDSKSPEDGDNKKGKMKLAESSGEEAVAFVSVNEEGFDVSASAGRRRLSREDKGKAVVLNGDSLHNVVVEEGELGNSDAKHSEDNEPLQDHQQTRNTNTREHGSKRMERFRDIARENASRFALFDESEDEVPPPEPEVPNEIEDWPGPFSTAMKIIRDREKKSVQINASSEKSLVESIKWNPKRSEGHIGARFSPSVPSLQEQCLKILAKNVDAIVSLDSVPDPLRHRLSHLLCDSRRINGHFFELLVGGSPTEIRVRDCSWLTEEQFTKSFQRCDTANMVVLQLDQSGRCLPDYVILATLAQSPRQLPRLTCLSLSGACRLSDVALRSLVSSAPALRSINLSQCSLLTSSSLFILAESLRSLLKELYLDDCQGIDAALIVPALKELEHLEVLSVAGIQTVRDEFISDYIIARGHNMKELVLKDCINLTDASMKVIAEHCPGLCVLDLMNLCKLTDISIGYLTNGCRALHTLKLCRNPFSDEAIAAFVETTGEALKELSLNNIKKVGYHTTLSLASHAKSLHTLDLSWCRNLTDNAMGLIVDSCLSLRLLKLFGCTQLTDVFLNGHSNLQLQIIGVKMSSVLQHVKVPDPHQGALNYSSISVV